MANILVAGGAGYIGAHTCLDLFNKGFTPIVYDNLSNGHAEFAKWGPLEIGDIRDRSRLDEVLNLAASGAGRRHRQDRVFLDLRHIWHSLINTDERGSRPVANQSVRSKQAHHRADIK